jgi:hypothetical protein
MVEYTEKDHADCLIKMLNEIADIGNACPPTLLESWNGNYSSILDENCKVCNDFIGFDTGHALCPCHRVGCEEAVEMTWEALKKGRWI